MPEKENKEKESQSFFTPQDDTPVYRQKFFLAGSSGSGTANRQPISLAKCIVSSPTVTTVSTDSNTTVETNLATIVLTSPEIDLVNKVIRITALGTYTSDGTRIVTVRVGSGTAPTTEWNSMVSTAAVTTNIPWNLIWTGIVASIGSSGTLEAQMVGSINNVSKNDANSATVALNTTATLTIALTAQWSAVTAGNSITVRQFIVEILN